MRGQRTRANPSASVRSAQRVAALAAAGVAGLSGPAVRAANDAYATDATSGFFSNSFTPNTTTPTTGGTSPPANGDGLFFGAETTGTTAVNNNLSSASFAGITFIPGASAFTIGGNAFTLTGAITNNATSTETINNAITDASALVVTGPGAVTLGAASSTLSVAGLTLGTTVADNGNTNVAVTGESGVTLNLTNAQNLGAVNVGGGANVINVGASAAITTTTIANLSTSDRFTALNINLGAGGSVTTNSTNTNGVIAVGSQYNLLTLNGTDFAANSTNASGGGLVAATYTPTTTATLGTSSQNTNVVTDVTLTGAATTNSLRFADTVGHTITEASGQILALNGTGGTGGSILMSAANGAVTNTITGGSLTGSQNRGLSVLDYDTTGGSSLVINSNFNNFLIGNGVTISTQVLVAGGGNVTFGGANLINGQLLVDGSKLTVASDSNLGGSNGTVSVTAATNGSTSVTLAATPSTSAGLVVGDTLLGQTISNIVGATVTLASAYTGATFSTATTVGFVEGGSVNLNGGTLLANGTFSLSETGTQIADTTLGVTDVRNRNVGLGLKGGTIDVTSTNTLTIPGVISGSTGASVTLGTLNKTDGGTLAITGSTANTSLFLNNQAGTTTLGKTVGSGVGNAATTVTVTGGTVQLATGATGGQATNLVVNGGTFDLNGFGGIQSSFTTLNGAGGTITNTSTTANSVLYIGQGGAIYNDSLSVASTISNGTAKTVAVNIQGSSTSPSTRTVAFSGPNTYSGGTTVGIGTLRANNTAAAGTSGTGLGDVVVNGTSTSFGTLGGTGTAGNTSTGAGAALGTGVVTINGYGTITAGASNASTGTLTTGAESWNSSSGQYLAKVFDASNTSTGAAGNDRLVMSALTITSGFAVNISTSTVSSLSSGTVLVLANDKEGGATNPFNTSGGAAPAGLSLEVNGSTTTASSDNLTLATQSDSLGNGGYDLILESSTAATPEPASLLLAGAALAPLALGRRRRQRA